MRPRAALSVPATALGLAFVLAACSSSGGGGSPSGSTAAGGGATTSASATASPSGTSQASASATSATSSPSATSTPECVASQLAGTLDTLQGAAGSSYEGFEIRNTSSSACTLDGFFGVQLRGSQGQTIGVGYATVSSGSVRPVRVTLPPNTAGLNSGNDHGHAIFYMQSNQQCTNAVTPQAFLFTPPHLSGSFAVSSSPVNGPSSPPEICGSVRVGPISPPGTSPPSF